MRRYDFAASTTSRPLREKIRREVAAYLFLPFLHFAVGGPRGSARFARYQLTHPLEAAKIT